jgi:serine/threonine protein kinase
VEGAGEAEQPGAGDEIDFESKVRNRSFRVLLKKSVGSVINEKSILEQISNPFIINMKSSFQDREYLYMTMEYLRGGDLRYHLCFYEFFNEEQTSTSPLTQNSSPAASSSASSSSTPRGSSTATSSPKTSSSKRTGT